MSILDKLARWFDRKPLVVLPFADGFRQALLESGRGLDRFTVAKPHGVFEGLKAPTLCLVQMLEGTTPQFYVGVITFKARVTTFESRITIIKLQPLHVPPSDPIANRFSALALPAVLTSGDSVQVINALSQDAGNKRAIEAAASHLPGVRTISMGQWEQLDAIKMAMEAFGLRNGTTPRLVDVDEGSDSTLNYLEVSALENDGQDTDPTLDHTESHVLEDNVIAKDASIVPGFSLIGKGSVRENVMFLRDACSRR